ncbi:unnamed protein product, partial [Choristocarpus tenellus]
AFIQALPETLPGLLPYVSKVYGNTRNLLFPLDEGGTKILPSRSGPTREIHWAPSYIAWQYTRPYNRSNQSLDPKGFPPGSIWMTRPFLRAPTTIAAFEQSKASLHHVGIDLNMGKTFVAPPQ